MSCHLPWNGPVIAKKKKKKKKIFEGDRYVYGIDYSNGFIDLYFIEWSPDLSNCIHKYAHLVCQLYPNKVFFFKDGSWISLWYQNVSKILW